MMDPAPHITAIKATKRDPLRSSIDVDGRFVAALPHETIDDLGLAVGAAWDEPTAGRVEAAAAMDKAMRDAMRLLNRRAYSSGELRDRLKRREHGEATIDQAVSQLAARRLIDDEAYGRSVIGQLLSKKPAGRRFLQGKLDARRVPREVIERLLDETDAVRDPLNDAVELATKRLRTAALQRCDPAGRRRRLWALLCRRGFDSETTTAALERLDMENEM